MSGKKYKVARAYSLRVLKDDSPPGTYRKISDDITTVRNPRVNRPLSFAYGEKDISVLRRYNGEREDISVDRNRNALTWSGESPFKADSSNSLSELPPQILKSNGINDDSELLPYDLDKKGADDLQHDSYLNLQPTKRRRSSSGSSSSSTNEKRGKLERKSSSSSANERGKLETKSSSSSFGSVTKDNKLNSNRQKGTESKDIPLGTSNIVTEKKTRSDFSSSDENVEHESLKRKSSSSSEEKSETEGNLCVNSVEKRLTVYEEPWDSNTRPEKIENSELKYSDHNTSLSSIENQIIGDHLPLISTQLNTDKEKKKGLTTNRYRTESSSSSDSRDSKSSGEKHVTSSQSSEAPPLPTSEPPEIMVDSAAEQMEVKLISSDLKSELQPQNVNYLGTADSEPEVGCKRLSVTYYGPVYMHDNVLIMPTSSTQFSGGDSSYQSGMIFQGQIELEHVPQDQFDIDSTESAKEEDESTNKSLEISNIKISLSTDNSDINELDDDVVPVITAEFVNQNEASVPPAEQENTKSNTDSSSSSSSSSSESENETKHSGKRRIKTPVVFKETIKSQVGSNLSNSSESDTEKEKTKETKISTPVSLVTTNENELTKTKIDLSSSSSSESDSDKTNIIHSGKKPVGSPSLVPISTEDNQSNSKTNSSSTESDSEKDETICVPKTQIKSPVSVYMPTNNDQTKSKHDSSSLESDSENERKYLEKKETKKSLSNAKVKSKVNSSSSSSTEYDDEKQTLVLSEDTEKQEILRSVVKEKGDEPGKVCSLPINTVQGDASFKEIQVKSKSGSGSSSSSDSDSESDDNKEKKENNLVKPKSVSPNSEDEIIQDTEHHNGLSEIDISNLGFLQNTDVTKTLPTTEPVSVEPSNDTKSKSSDSSSSSSSDSETDGKQNQNIDISKQRPVSFEDEEKIIINKPSIGREIDDAAMSVIRPKEVVNSAQHVIPEYEQTLEYEIPSVDVNKLDNELPNEINLSSIDTSHSVETVENPIIIKSELSLPPQPGIDIADELLVTPEAEIILPEVNITTESSVKSEYESYGKIDKDKTSGQELDSEDFKDHLSKKDDKAAVRLQKQKSKTSKSSSSSESSSSSSFDSESSHGVDVSSRKERENAKGDMNRKKKAEDINSPKDDDIELLEKTNSFEMEESAIVDIPSRKTNLVDAVVTSEVDISQKMKEIDSKMIDLDLPDINKPIYDAETEVIANIKTCEPDVDMSSPATTSDITFDCKPEIDSNLKTQSLDYPQIDPGKKLMNEFDRKNAFEVDIPSDKVSKTFDDTVSMELPQNYMQYVPDNSEFEVPKGNVPEISREQPIEDTSPKSAKKVHKTKDSGKRKPDFGLKIPEKITSLVHKLSFKGGDKNRLKSTENLTASEPTLDKTVTISGTEMSPKTKDKKNARTETKEPTKKASKKRSKFRLKKKHRSTSSSSSSSSESEDEKKKIQSDMNHADKEVQVNVFNVDLKTKAVPKPNGKQSKNKKLAREGPSPPTTPESPFDKLSHIFHRTHKAKITEPIKEDKKKEKEKKENKKSPSRSSSDNRDRSTSQTSTDEQTTKSDVCNQPEDEDDKHRYYIETDDKSPLKTLQEYSKLLDKQVARTRPDMSPDTDENTTKENNELKGTSDEENPIVQDKETVSISCSVEEQAVEEKIERVEAAQKSSPESVSSDNENLKEVITARAVERKASLSSLEREIFSTTPQSVNGELDVSIRKPSPSIDTKYTDRSSEIINPDLPSLDLQTDQTIEMKKPWISPADKAKLKRSDSSSSTSSSSSSSSSKSSQKSVKEKVTDVEIHYTTETKKTPANVEMESETTQEEFVKEEEQPRLNAVLNKKLPNVSETEDTQPDIAPRRELSIDNTERLEVEHALQTLDNSIIAAEQSPPKYQGHFVVVAIDFGTAYSGYAFSFTRDPDSIHMMRKWEGGDPGIINQKTPTIMLLTPDGSFHSFGYNARDNYHDLDKERAQEWMYFDKFKMTLHTATDLSTDTMLTAANGRNYPALKIFTYAMSYLRDHVIRELSDQSGVKILNEDIRWVVCVPAIWKAPAKQFMRQAAYKAGIASEELPDQLLIALEPEAASIYCRKLRMHQLVPESPRQVQSPTRNEPVNLDNAFEVSNQGTRYMVVDCGGGTVDITVHELDSTGKLAELHKASGGPYGSIGVDVEFEKLLMSIFGKTLIEQYKVKRSAGWVDMLIAFESRKRSASPYKTSHLNVALPFSFIDYYRKHKLTGIDTAIKRHGDKDITWSSQGMLRLAPEAMNTLFKPTIQKIKEKIGSILNNNIKDLKYMFLVGGFAESAIVQNEIRQEFGNLIQVIIPQGVAMTILKGAVLFGLDPTIVNVRRCPLTYGVGVLNRYNPKKHPLKKKVSRQEIEWCTDIFDKYVVVDQAVTIGDVILRSYTPARPDQRLIQINIYCCEDKDPEFITDPGVHKVGTVTLHLSGTSEDKMPKRREIQTRMQFGETEIRVSALDVSTGEHIQSTVDFLSR